MKDVSGKLISLTESLHANSPERVCAYGGLSLEFTLRSGIALFHLSFFKSDIEMVIETAPSWGENSGFDTCPDRNPFDLECADDAVLLSKDPNKLQVFLGRLNDYVGTFGMGFAPSRCKTLL